MIKIGAAMEIDEQRVIETMVRAYDELRYQGMPGNSASHRVIAKAALASIKANQVMLRVRAEQSRAKQLEIKA